MVAVILQYIVYPNNMLYTLDLHNVIYQLYLNKARNSKKKYERASRTESKCERTDGWIDSLVVSCGQSFYGIKKIINLVNPRVSA